MAKYLQIHYRHRDGSETRSYIPVDQEDFEGAFALFKKAGFEILDTEFVEKEFTCRPGSAVKSPEEENEAEREIPEEDRLYPLEFTEEELKLLALALARKDESCCDSVSTAIEYFYLTEKIRKLRESIYAQKGKTNG